MEISVAQAQLFFLSLTRVLAILIHVPVLGGRAIPNLVKIGLGILLTLIIAPGQLDSGQPSLIPTFAFGFAIARELLVGTLAGYASLLTFNVLQIAGHMMGLGSGFGAGQILNPALENTGSPLNQIFTMTALLIFLIVDGHHSFLLGLQNTFALVPLNESLPNFSLGYLAMMAGSMITIGVQMSLPILGPLLLTDITLGLLARVAPQIHVFFLGIPLKIGVALLALALGMSTLLPTLTNLFQSIGARTLELLGT